MTLRSWSIRAAIVAAACIVAHPTFGASCDMPDPCVARACRLDAEIAKAKAMGNPKVLARLERERTEMAHCSDDGLKQKRKVALEQAQRRIDQREADLKQAGASGDAQKLKKAQRNLESARQAYAEMEKSPL